MYDHQCIVPGVTIIGEPKEFKESILLSSGVRPVSLAEQKEGRYLPNSVIPKKPWRKPSCSEFETLFVAPINPGSWIKIISLPDEIVASFHFLHTCLYPGITTRDLSNYSKHPRCASAVEQLKQHIQRFSNTSTFEIRSFGLVFKRPGLVTVTQNMRLNGLYNGLHLDSWFPTTIQDHMNSPNRILVNLGLESRGFLFINQTILDMARMLRINAPAVDVSADPAYKIVRKFLFSYPDYPVTYLKIKPGDAYIAPTENICHDGSSEGQTMMDITLSFMGHFSPTPQ